MKRIGTVMWNPAESPKKEQRERCSPMFFRKLKMQGYGYRTDSVPVIPAEIMVIDINKNIDNYKETVLLGLTAKQLVYSVLLVAVGGGIVLLLYQKVGLMVSAYIAIPAVTPIALSGFYSYNGMSFMEMMKLKMHFAFGNRALAYVSTEGEDVIREIRQQEMIADKKTKQKNSRKKTDSRDDFGKTAKKMLCSVIMMLCVLGILLGAAIWYKYFR